MTRLIIADAGPLIAFARIKKLSLLRELFNQIVVPKWIYQELQPWSERPGARMISAAFQDAWLKIEPSFNRRGLPQLKPTVDLGEAEAIYLAYVKNAGLLLIDDRSGRRAAKVLGIPIMGTGGVLVIAKKRNLLGKVRPILQMLQNTGYRLAPDLCRRILELAGE